VVVDNFDETGTTAFGRGIAVSVGVAGREDGKWRTRNEVLYERH